MKFRKLVWQTFDIMATHYLKAELYQLIKQDESIFDFIQEGSLDGLWYWDLENPENEWMNARFWEILGYNPKDMPHKASAWQDIINQDDLNMALDNFNKHAADPTHPYDQEVRYTHKNGSTVWVRCRGLIVRDKVGKPIRMLGAHQDITRLKENEKKYQTLAKETANNLNNLKAATNITTIFLNHKLEVSEFTPSAQTEENLTTEIEPSLNEIARYYGLENIKDECNSVLKSLKSIEREVVCISGIVWWMRISPYKTLENNFEGLIITLTDISEKKQLDKEVKMLSNAIENSVDAYSIVNEDGIFTYINETYLKMWDYDSPNEVIGTPHSRHCVNPTLPDKIFKKVLKDQKGIFEFKALRKDGSTFDVSMSVTKYIDESGKIFFPAFSKDVTKENQQKQEIDQHRYHLEALVEKKTKILTESENRFRILFDDSPTGIYETDVEGKCLMVNKRWQEMAGMTNEEALGDNWINGIYKEDRQQVFDNWNKYASSGDSWSQEYRFCNKEGKITWVQGVAKPLFNEKNEITGYIGTNTDISERKAVQLEIHHQRDRFESVINSVPTRIFWKDKEGVYLGCNPNFAKDAGVQSIDEVIGKKDEDLVWGEAANLYRADDREVMESGKPKLHYEEPFIGFDGEEIIWETNKMPLRNNEGEIIGVLATSENITERKRAENKLKESEERLASAQKIAQLGNFEHDFERDKQWWSDELFDILGFEHAPFPPNYETFSKRMLKEDVERLNNLVYRALNYGEDYTITYQYQFPNNEIKYIYAQAKVIFDKNKPMGLKGTAQDITKRMLSEHALKASEEKFRIIAENSADFIWQMDLRLNFTYASPSIYNMTGYTNEEWVGTNLAKHCSRKELFKMARQALGAIKNYKTTQTVLFESKIFKKNGEEMPVEILGKLLFNDNGLPIALQGATRDISERKLAERELKASEERYRLIFETAATLITSVDKDGIIVDCNQRIKEILGYKKSEIVGNPMTKIIHPDYYDKAFKSLNTIMKQGYNYNQIYKMVRKDGSIIDVNINASAIINNGVFERTICVIGDITERLRAEEKIKHSEAKFRGVFENSNVGIAIGSPDGTVLDVNDEYLKISGYTREEFVNLDYAAVTHPDDIAIEQPLFERLKKGEIDNYRIEKRFLAKNGKYLWLDAAISCRRYDDGKIDLTIALVIDISEGKQANETVNVFFDQPMNIHLIGTIEGEMLRVNAGWVNTLGYSKEETLGKNMLHFIHPEDIEATVQELKELEIGKTAFYFENRFKHKNGNYVTLAWSAIYNTSGKLIHGVAKDITQQKKYHEELIKSEGNYKALSENARHIILTHNFKGEITYANNYTIEFIGISREQIIGADIQQFISTDDGVEKYYQRKQDFEITKRKSHHYEVEIILPKGEKRVLEVIGSLIKVDSKVDSVLITAYDITERKKAEKKIRQQNEEYEALNEELRHTNKELFSAIGRERQSNDRFDKAMEATSDGLWDWDLITNDIYYSPRWKALLGYKNDELPNDFSVWETLTKPEDIKRTLKKLSKLKSGDIDKFNIEFEMKHKKGHWIFIHSRANVFRNKNGEASRVVGTHTNITKRKQAELEKQQKLIIENLISRISTEFIQTADINLTINKAFAEFGAVNNASRIYLFEIDEEDGTMSNSHEWCNQKVSPQIDNLQKIPLSQFPWWIEKMYANEVINIQDVSAMPHEAAMEKAALEQQDISSVLVVPIFIKDKLFGYLGFDDINETGSWKSSDFYLLEMLASILSNAIARKISEQKNRESEEKLRLSIDNSPLGIAMSDMDGHLISVNKAYELMLGYNKDELLNMSFYDITHPDSLAENRAIHSKVSDKKLDNISFEKKYIRKDGKTIDVRLNSGVIKDSKNKAMFVMSFFEDITEQKIKENTIRESEEKLRLAINNSPLGITLTDKKGKFLSINKAYEKLVGYTEQELLNMSFYDITHADYLSKNKALFDAMATNKAPGFAIDKKYIHKNGNLIDVRIHAGGIHNEKGEVVFGMAFAEDITERKALENRNAMLYKAIESSMVTVVITDIKGNIEYVNPFFTTTTGYSKEEVIGDNLRILKSGMQDNSFYTELWQTILSGKTWLGELQNKKKNGEIYWENAAISPVINNEGEITQFIAVKEDITQLKSTLTDLKIAKEKAEEANALKTEFLHNMSHEIRTPMNGIMGFSNLLCDLEGCSEIQKNYTAIIQNSSTQLLRIIDDILEISRLETKQLSIHNSEFDLNQFVMEIFAIYDLKSKERKIPLYVSKELSNRSCNIINDKTKLHKILCNLIDNAFKFTNSGRIEFGYTIKDSHIVFFVSDTGIGISANNQERIFKRFSQESSETAMEFGGLGLGLSIAKENAELLGGNITVNSEKGKGTTFYIEIPYKTNQDNANKNINTSESAKDDENAIQILIAEDEEVNYLYLEAILDNIADFNVELHHVINGDEAVKKCLKDDVIDIVLMDIKMPVMNGYIATEKIKEQKPYLPIIAQTAYSTTSERDLALKHGCDDFISKPIDKEKLLQLINTHLVKK